MMAYSCDKQLKKTNENENCVFLNRVSVFNSGDRFFTDLFSKLYLILLMLIGFVFLVLAVWMSNEQSAHGSSSASTGQGLRSTAQNEDESVPSNLSLMMSFSSAEQPKEFDDFDVHMFLRPLAHVMGIETINPRYNEFPDINFIK
jgi:hypothetical protein